MNIADILNPILSSPAIRHELTSPPLSPRSGESSPRAYGKARSRFSDLEDAIICEGVARGLTWGQISGQLPHRKRATCFNRYRTLQGVRKSRKRAAASKHRVDNVSIAPTLSSSSRRSSIFTPSPSPPATSNCCLPSPPALLLEDGFSKNPSYQRGLFDLSHQHDHLSSPSSNSSSRSLSPSSSFTPSFHPFRQHSNNVNSRYRSLSSSSLSYEHSRRHLDSCF